MARKLVERKTRASRGVSGAGGIVPTIFPSNFLIAISLAVFGLAILLPGAPQQTVDNPDKPISVDVNLVVVRAIVSEGGGHPISGLKQEDFEVYEDGVRQPIRVFTHEDIPVNAGLVVDHSGSMRRKLTEVGVASRAFAELSNPEDRMFVVNFNDHVALGLPEGTPFTGSSAALQSAISEAQAEGRTALYDGIAKALDQLKLGNLDKKALIVVSDGGDNASRHTLPQVLKLAEQSSAVIYTVGIFDEDDPDANRSVLRTLAKSSGGIAFFSDDVAELKAFCERIAHDIRNQYTIGYAPLKPAKPGEYRSIRIVAKAPHHGKLSVRARTGYLVSGGSRDTEPNPLKTSR